MHARHPAPLHRSTRRFITGSFGIFGALVLGSLSCGDGAPPTPEASATALSAPSSKTSSAPTTGTANPSGEPLASATPTNSAPVASASSSAAASSAPTSPSSTPTTTPTVAVTASATATPTTTASTAPTSLSPAAPGSAEAVAQEIDVIFQPVERYKAKFIQKYRQKISGKEKESTGTLFVERPNKFSFRYDAPNKNRIVSDGKIVKVYSAEDAQMYEHSAQNSELPDAFAFLTGAGLRSRMSFTFNEKAKFDLGPVLVGAPKTANPHYESMLFYVDKASLEKKSPKAVAGILILDVQGNRNRFELSGAELPTTIDPTEFNFTPPAGTDIKR